MLTLTIETGNDAVDDHFDVADILRKTADRIARGDMGGKVMDLNGNSVGRFELEWD